MGKIISPVLFSDYFKVKKSLLDELGVMDPFLNFDNKLFIDPFLLARSIHPEMQEAHKLYESFFAGISKLLMKSDTENDITWTAAKDKFEFKEIKETCLGYGDESIDGSGWGEKLIIATLRRAKKIIDLGIEDSEFFSLVFLFQELIGPDKISDMTTHIILPSLLKFNKRIIGELGNIDLEPFEIRNEIHKLIKNPAAKKHISILLVPKDIVRNLPIAANWAEVCQAARKNHYYRESLSMHIAKIWKKACKKEEKEKIWKEISGDPKYFNYVLNTVKKINKKAYNFVKDPEGIIFWSKILYSIDKENPLDLSRYKNNAPQDIETIYSLVKEIINQFKHLIEKRGLWTELWIDKKVRNETNIQKLFYAVAESYCKANNLDITPEAETGNGPVDFKFSIGFTGRVIVEIKKSNNPKLVHGYEKQLEIYKEAESTNRGIFLIINIKDFESNRRRIEKIRNEKIKNGELTSEVIIVDGTRKKSASIRK